MSTYLVALIAGPYASWHDEYVDEGGTIPLGIYCRASLAQHMDHERLFTETKQGFAFYHRNFGVRTRSASTTSSSSRSSTRGRWHCTLTGPHLRPCVPAGAVHQAPERGPQGERGRWSCASGVRAGFREGGAVLADAGRADRDTGQVELLAPRRGSGKTIAWTWPVKDGVISYPTFAPAGKG